MLRVAVIGAGYIGSIHARIYSQRSDVQLVAVVDRHPERASTLASALGAHGYRDIATMLHHHRPDAASVAVTVDQLYPTASSLIEQGIHTLIEKPMALNSGDGDKLVVLAQKFGVIAAVGYSECFNPAATAMRQLVAEDRIGTIYEFHAMRYSPPPNRALYANVIYDLLGHDICLLRLLFPEQPIAQVQSAAVFSDAGEIEGYGGLFILSSGTIGTINTNRYSADKLRQWSLIGSEGTLNCDLLRRRVSVQCLDRAIESIPIDDSEPLGNEIDNFVSAVQTGQPPLVPITLGAEVLKILDAASESVMRPITGP